MSTDMENSRVLIIGAGPGGLALAQVLRNRNIPFEVFERDHELMERKQGWAIALVEAIAELQGLLSADVAPLEQCSVNYGIEENDVVGLVDATNGLVVGKIGGVSKEQPGYVLRADREGFRELLWKNIPVSMGKHFDHYTEDEQGVTVHFRDGSQARGAILVGADGAHSHVRGQLMSGQDGPVVSQYIPLIGECELPPKIFEPLRALANAAIIASKPGLRFMIGQRSIKPDMSSANYYWAVCYQSDQPDVESAWVSKGDQNALFNKALEMTDGVHESLTEIIQFTGASGMAIPPLKFSEYVPPRSLPRGRVTILGDAAHAMIPFKAAGANTAVRDACDLGRLIIKQTEDGGVKDWPELLEQYCDIMLPRGREKVLASRAAGQDATGRTALLEGRVSASDK